MPFDFVGAAEALAAHGTAVGLLAGVDPHVDLQVSHLSEAFSTNLTAERFFSGVAPLVLLQPAGGAAAFPANAAAVGLFPSVHLHVHVQMPDVAKCLTAHFTTER